MTIDPFFAGLIYLVFLGLLFFMGCGLICMMSSIGAFFNTARIYIKSKRIKEFGE